MIVEVIAVGTELLLGHTVNTNASHIGARLADEGFDAHFQVTVGDNLARMVTALRIALARADAVVVTGGIGPTQDDLTKDALCRLTGRGMTRDEAHATSIRDRVRAVRGAAPASALRMADYPSGSEPLPNRNGAALGVAMRHDGRLLFAMPGVPSEMRAMLDEQVLPRLRAAIDAPTVLRSRVVKTWGHGESHIADVLADLYASVNPSIAFLIDETEVRVRISAKADDEAAAFALIAPIQREIERRLAGSVFGHDDETGLGVLAALLSARGWSVAVAEVATAGLVGARLAADRGVAFAGATTWPDDQDTSALALARGAVAAFGADVGIGVGHVDDGSSDDGSATSLDVAVTTPASERVHTVRVLGDRERARTHAASSAIHTARLAVAGTLEG